MIPADNSSESQRASENVINLVDDDNDSASDGLGDESDIEMEDAELKRSKGGGSREKAPVKLFFERRKDGVRECRVCQ